mgnify:FL=1
MKRGLMEKNNIFVGRALTSVHKRGIHKTLGKKITFYKEPPRPQGGTRSLNTGASLFLRNKF